MTKWHYLGDLNLEYGGYFFNFDNWQHGYVDCVEVIDLASACGFNGAVAIDVKVVNGTDDAERINTALRVIGARLLDNGDIDDNGRRIIRKRQRNAYKMCIAYALACYGYYDIDSTSTEVLQLESDQPLKFDGWQATRYKKSLRRYVSNVCREII